MLQIQGYICKAFCLIILGLYNVGYETSDKYHQKASHTVSDKKNIYI